MALPIYSHFMYSNQLFLQNSVYLLEWILHLYPVFSTWGVSDVQFLDVHLLFHLQRSIILCLTFPFPPSLSLFPLRSHLSSYKNAARLETHYIVFTHFYLRKLLFAAREIIISIPIFTFLLLLFMSFFFLHGNLIEVVITVFLEY